MKNVQAIAGCILIFCIYAMIIGSLRNMFDDRWPFINSFLVSPGVAAKNLALVVGLWLSIHYVRDREPKAKLFAIGFGLMLLGPFIWTVYIAWAWSRRTELDLTVFDTTYRYSFWYWYHQINIPQVISAVGAILVVVATDRALRGKDEPEPGS
jgi:hypothetical protein